MRYPKAIQNLIDELSRLPSVGPKTAERYVFYLLKQAPENLQRLAQLIAELKEKITVCQNCLAITEINPCPICTDKQRNEKQICVVANSQDMLTIEAVRQFTGQYHVLNGLINTLEGIKPENLNIRQLVQKVKSGKILEIILALSPTIEGETTSMYLIKILKPYKIKITRLARGLPTGADLEYADDLTIVNAFKFRNEM